MSNTYLFPVSDVMMYSAIPPLLMHSNFALPFTICLSVSIFLIYFVSCGPDENRTHLTLLAKENRQPWKHASPFCRVDGTRTRICLHPKCSRSTNYRTTLYIKKSHINLFLICVRCLYWYLLDFLYLLSYPGLILIYPGDIPTHPWVRVASVPKNDNNLACPQ